MADAKKKRWSYSVGERGRNRVRAFAHNVTGGMFLEFYEPTRIGERPKVNRIALGHSDQERAKEAAERLAAELRSATPPATAHMTIAALFEMYQAEVSPQKSAGKQRHDRMCVEMFLRALGRDREARTLSRREWDRFIRDRRSGVLGPASAKKKRTVRDRQIAYDLRFLLAVLNWATMAGDGRGGPLLDRNPLKGLPVPREESPRRPLLDSDQYAKVLDVAPSVSPLFELALILAHETGHRANSIRQLRWSDIDLAKKNVRWRAEADKIGLEHSAPLTDDAATALDSARSTRPAIGDAWVFPAPRDPGKPIPRITFLKWWEKAEQLAKLPRVPGRGWHSLRRKFATDLKATPLKDLCALGGWKNAQTILSCYQQADEATMRAALESRKARIVASDR